jgi:hypothetical protein
MLRVLCRDRLQRQEVANYFSCQFLAEDWSGLGVLVDAHCRIVRGLGSLNGHEVQPAV